MYLRSAYWKKKRLRDFLTYYLHATTCFLDTEQAQNTNQTALENMQEFRLKGHLLTPTYRGV